MRTLATVLCLVVTLICVAQEPSGLPPGPSNPAQGKGLKHKLTTAETMEIGEAYDKVLLAKSRLFKLLGSKPLGQVDEKGFDLTAGGTALSGKYNQYVAQTTMRSIAGDVFTPTKEQETTYRNLASELKEKGVLAELDNISDAQDALSSKVDAISKDGGQITSLKSVYSSYKKLAITHKKPIATLPSASAPRAKWTMLSPRDLEHLRPLEEVISRALVFLEQRQCDKAYGILAAPKAITAGETQGKTEARVAEMMKNSRQFIDSLTADLKSYRQIWCMPS